MDEEIKEALYKKNKSRFTKKLRRSMTHEEAILWRVLRNRRCRGLKFCRQVNVGPYIADFICREQRVIIEIDGKIHEKAEQKEHDDIRDKYFIERDYKILRITNDKVHESLPEVLEMIFNFINHNKI